MNVFIRILKERMNGGFLQNWNSKLIEYSRARAFVLFYFVRLRPYLTYITI